jgi:hypothetical protein
MSRELIDSPAITNGSSILSLPALP